MNKRFSLRRTSFLLPAIAVLLGAALAIHHFLNVGIIFAADIPGGGAAIRPGCTWELAVSHCTEATWRYYSVTDDVNGTVDVSDPNSIKIKGTVDSTAPGAELSGCAAVGGYWRYALVVNHDFQAEHSGVKGAYFYQGQQVGVGAIGGGSSVEHSNMWGDGGREQYSANPRSGGGGTDWDFVKAEYDRAYAKGYVTLGWNASSRLGAFCAEPPSETDEDKETGFNCLDYGGYTEHYGRTYAEAAVRNLSALAGSKTAAGDSSVNTHTTAGTGTYSNRWKVTDSGDNSSTTKVYARPGDSVQFRHTLCYGNQKVKGNADFVYSGLGGRTSQNTVDGTRYFNKRNFFNITAYKNDSPNSMYAFDSDSGTSTFINGGDFTLRETTEYFSEGNVKSGKSITDASFGDNNTGYRSNEVETSSFGLRIYSPTNAANNRYNCNGMTAFLSDSYVSPGFQVPGYTSLIKSTDYCDAVNTEHIDSNTVGTKISQKLTANIVKSWVARKSSNVSGICTCSLVQNTACKSCESRTSNPGNKSEGSEDWTTGGEINFTQYGGSSEAWQNREVTVYPGSLRFYTRVADWESTSITSKYLAADDDAAHKPHGAHYETYEDAIGGAGSRWGDWRYQGGCSYDTCTKGCDGGTKAWTTGYDYDAYGAVTKTYIYTYNCKVKATGDITSDWQDSISYTRTRANDLPGNAGYPYRSVSVSEPTKTAEVYTPYNYDTSVSTTINTQPLYIGEAVKLSATVAFTPRNNALVGTSTYATITKNSHISIVQFVIPADKTMEDIQDSIKGKSDYDAHGSADHYTPCLYYQSSVGAIGCAVSNDNDAGGEVYNTTGNYAGERKNYSFSQTIPDESTYPVGSKYCIAVGVFPSDSYDRPGVSGTSLTESDTENAGMSASGKYWNISGATCRTIAKKPNFQVWGAGVYTDGGINTSYSRKNVGAGLDYRNNYEFVPTGYFGSWSEYTAISNGVINNFATAATLGYSGYNFSATPGGSPTTNPDHCKSLSLMSIAHDDCSSSAVVGNAGGIHTSTVFLERLRARYTPPADSTKVTSPTDSSGNVIISKSSFTSIDPERPYYAYVDGNAVISSDLVISSGTYVLYVTGKLAINGDICYGNSTSCNGGSQISTLSAQNNGAIYNNITGLPQLLIFADDINIGRDATQIDSWLVASGTLNTCEGRKLGKIVIHDGVGEDGTADYVEDGLTSSVCDHTLIINGPVFAKSIELHRPAGAAYGSGQDYSSADVQNVNYADNGSITPAEIFNLRPDAYLWSYNQAQRYSEAVVVYTRELPPRY